MQREQSARAMPVKNFLCSSTPGGIRGKGDIVQCSLADVMHQQGAYLLFCWLQHHCRILNTYATGEGFRSCRWPAPSAR